MLVASFENSKVHATIRALLHKVGMVREVVLLAMFKDKDSIVFQYVVFKHHRWYLGQFWKGIRRVGEDEVEFLLASLDESKNVATDEDVLICV